MLKFEKNEMLYLCCTQSIKKGFRKPEALCLLVAGTGLEPVTFGL